MADEGDSLICHYGVQAAHSTVSLSIQEGASGNEQSLMILITADTAALRVSRIDAELAREYR